MPQYRETLLNKAEDHAKTYKTVKDKEAYTRLLDEVDNTLQEVEDQLFQNKGECYLNYFIYFYQLPLIPRKGK